MIVENALLLVAVGGVFLWLRLRQAEGVIAKLQKDIELLQDDAWKRRQREAVGRYEYETERV